MIVGIALGYLVGWIFGDQIKDLILSLKNKEVK